MKKYIYTVMLIILSITTSQAQRMIPKQKRLEVNVGVLSDDKIGNDYYINIGMTIGVTPVIGITLPFISYGGSSLWTFTLLLFILLKMDASND